ncbi:MAG: hypothetical protein K2L00_04045, partial [Muribaculaceae bacterium]|nr:hypothetical protein [Muribaculaceae bacterium]
MSTTPFAYNKISMDTPYTITGEEEVLLFGYSLVVKDDMYYVPIDYVPTLDTAGIIGVAEDGKSLPEPTSYEVFGSVYGALCMSVTLENESFPKSVSFTSFPETICLELGKPLSLPITLSAASGSPVESISLEYTLDGKVNDFTYEAANPLPAGVSRNFTVNLDFPAQSAKFKEVVEFKLTKINGEENVCDGNTVSATVLVVDKAPVHRTLYEEYTGTWCQWCPRGFAALEYMRENHPDFVTASFHYGYGSSYPDPMQVINYYPSDAVESFPSAVLNRNNVVDPYYGSETYNYPVPVVGDIEALNAIPTTWDVSVSHEWTSTDLLVAKAEVANMAGFDDKDYRIAYL